jgi:Mg2+-importing ATPase
MIRTARRPFIDSMASTGLTALTIGVMAAGLLLPGSPLGSLIGLVPLPWSYYPFLALILGGYILCVQAVKRWYIGRFHAWL